MDDVSSEYAGFFGLFGKWFFHTGKNEIHAGNQNILCNNQSYYYS